MFFFSDGVTKMKVAVSQEVSFVLLFPKLLSLLNFIIKYCSDCNHCILKIFVSFFVFSGIYPYRSQISGLRLLMLNCMSELSVEVLKITKHPNEAAIKVRWRIKGIPSIRKVVPYIGRKITVDADGYRYKITLS